MLPIQRKGSAFDFTADAANDLSSISVPQKAAPLKKAAGWFKETPGKKSWLRRGSKGFLKDSPKKEIFTDSTPVTSEMQEIPDLEDLKEEEISAEVSKAPSLKVYKIATYQELDSDLSKLACFQPLDGTDLNLLTKRLLPEQMVKNEDESSWTWDTLFADVSSYFNAAKL